MRKAAHHWGCATAMCVALMMLACSDEREDAEGEAALGRKAQPLGQGPHGPHGPRPHPRPPGPGPHGPPGEGGDVVLSIPAAAPRPRLDGERDPQYAQAQVLGRVILGAPASANDLGAQFAVLHDSAALYVFVEVYDDQVGVDMPDGWPWDDDSIELYLDADASAGARYDGRDDVQLIVRVGDARARLGLRSAPIDPGAIGVVTQRTPGGYRAELVVPWSALSARWHPGKRIGLEVQVNDDDDGGARDDKLAWHAEDDEAWQVPARLALARLAPTQPRAAQFRALGQLPGAEAEPSSTVTALSAGGSVVVGVSASAQGPEAFRWTSGEGMRGLGGVPSSALAVSPSGLLTTGLAAVADAPGRVAGVWEASGAFARLRGGPLVTGTGLPTLWIEEPSLVRDDGRVFGICRQYGVGYPVGACRQDGPEQLTVLQPFTIVYAADDAGHLGGTRLPFRGEPIGSVAVLDGVALRYPTPHGCILPHQCRGEVRGISDGARVAVGTAVVPVPPAPGASGPPSAGPLYEAAFVYTEAGGVEELPDLPGGAAAAGAYAVSGDGRLIAGFGSDDAGRHAVVWRDRVPSKLVDLVVGSGGDVPAGWQLREVRAITADATVYAGNGARPDGRPEGFWVQLPARP